MIATVTDIATREYERNSEIPFVANPIFLDSDAVEQIEAMKPNEDGNSVSTEELPPYLAALYQFPLLTPKLERSLFLRMNFEKFQADRLRSQETKCTETIVAHLKTARDLRDQIVQSNLRLLVSIAKRFASPDTPFDELISEGHFPLMRAVELFDVSRGFKFSTYASNAIFNHLNRMKSKAINHSNRYVNADASLFEALPERDDAISVDGERSRKNNATVSRLLRSLDKREQRIIRSRFGLKGEDGPHAFAHIGKQVGLSKERVRQISIRAMEKLQVTAQALSASIV